MVGLRYKKAHGLATNKHENDRPQVSRGRSPRLPHMVDFHVANIAPPTIGANRASGRIYHPAPGRRPPCHSGGNQPPELSGMVAVMLAHRSCDVCTALPIYSTARATRFRHYIIRCDMATIISTTRRTAIFAMKACDTLCPLLTTHWIFYAPNVSRSLHR